MSGGRLESGSRFPSRNDARQRDKVDGICTPSVDRVGHKYHIPSATQANLKCRQCSGREMRIRIAVNKANKERLLVLEAVLHLLGPSLLRFRF